MNFVYIMLVYATNGASRVSLRLGHVRVLIAPRAIIHYAHVATLRRPLQYNVHYAHKKENEDFQK